MNRLPRTRLATVGTVLLLAASVSHAADVSESHTRPAVSSQRAIHKISHRRSKASRKPHPRGQQAIDTTRARQIQEALLREHYLTGQPSGVWDEASQEAMRRYQQAQGWQTKTVPDSRALIRLGLGPDHEHLLNPESAMTTGPALPQPQAKPQVRKSPSGGSLSLPAAASPAPMASPAITPALSPNR
jgi:hypothetical protein